MQCKCNYIKEFSWSYPDIIAQAFEYSRGQDVIPLNLLAGIDFLLLIFSVTHCWCKKVGCNFPSKNKGMIESILKMLTEKRKQC